MALGSVSDLRRSSFLLSKGCAAFRGRGHLEARTACRSEINMPLVLILGQSPSVFNEFIELSSKLDALGLFFARLLSGSQRHWLLCLEFGSCALAEWGVNLRAWAA